jgi:colanic acid biosynthesis glycosyl transferase WcaI
MRIIILNQFFYPDHSATSQLMTELAESLVERGVEVTALAGRGRYNGGERLSPRDALGGVRIERAWSTSFGKKNAVGRVLDYLSFYLGAAWKMFRLPRHELVMALTTPPLIGLVALAVGRLRGLRVVMLVQDVYPDVAVALGALSVRNPITRLVDWVSRQTLKRADRIVVLSQCMRDRIAGKIGAVSASRIDIIHNWADGSDIRPLSINEPNPFAEKNTLGSSFVVLFSGNLGRVNDFTTVLEAALLLRERRDIVFLFVGDGAKSREIEDFSERHKLSNMRLLPYQARADLRYSLAAGNALLVTLAQGLAGLSVPSKAYAILAAGRPILFVGDARCETARIVEEQRCGAAVGSGESGKLAQIIEEWACDKTRLDEMGRAGRALFEDRFDRLRAVEAYVQSFEKCMSSTEPLASASLVRDAKGDCEAEANL